MIDLFGILAVLDAFVRDQWPGILVGFFIAFTGISYIYERFLIERE